MYTSRNHIFTDNHIIVYLIHTYMVPMAPQSPWEHGALHGCAGGAGDAIISYFRSGELTFYETFIFSNETLLFSKQIISFLGTRHIS